MGIFKNRTKEEHDRTTKKKNKQGRKLVRNEKQWGGGGGLKQPKSINDLMIDSEIYNDVSGVYKNRVKIENYRKNSQIRDVKDTGINQIGLNRVIQDIIYHPPKKKMTQ